MFSFCLTLNQNICWPKCQSPLLGASKKIHRELFLHRYYGLRKYIKYDISNNVMLVFEVWKLLTINCVFPKCVQARLMTNKVKPSIGNKIIIRLYPRIVRYPTNDMWLPSPSIRIGRRKSWAYVACNQPKTTFLSYGHIKFYAHVLNSFTKKGPLQNMLCFMMLLLVKLIRLKSRITTLWPFEAFSKSKSIWYILLSLNIWSCKPNIEP